MQLVARGVGVILGLGLLAGQGALAAEPAPAPPECRRRIAGIEKSFRDADARVQWAGPLHDAGLEPPRARAGDSAREVTAVVQRGLSEVSFEGVKIIDGADDVARAAAIHREVETREVTRRMLHAAQPKLPPFVLGLWLDRRLPARDAVSLIEALGDKYQLGLLAEDPPPTRPAPPPVVARQIEKIRATVDAPAKFQLVEETMRAALGGCQAPPSAKGAKDSVVGALASCNCAGADLDMIEALVAVGNDLPRVYLRRIGRGSRPKVRLVLGPDATVQDLIDRIPARGGALSVRFDPSTAKPGR